MATDTKKPSKLAPAKPVPAAKPASKPAASAPPKPAKPLPVSKPAPVAAKVAQAEKPANGGRASKVDNSSKISYKQENPKRPSSESYARYEGYKKAKTVSEAIALGATRQDVNYDVAHGHATLG